MNATNVKIYNVDGSEYVRQFSSYASAKRYATETTQRIKVLAKNGKTSKVKFVQIMD